MKNFRTYGKKPFTVVVVHGGPGAPGEMRSVAQKLAEDFGVIEPFQTTDSIQEQIEELREVIEKNTKLPVYLIGWSWGAWLSYLLAAKYPNLIKKLFLISSGPFETSYAQRIINIRLERLSEPERKRVNTIIRLLQKGAVSDEIFREFGSLMDKADSYDPIFKDTNSDLDKINFQPKIYEKVWPEAEKLRKNGKLLELAEKITCPVVAIHGDYDPHPAEGVEKPLSKIIKQFSFHLLKNCGHHPWLEKKAKDKFYKILKAELN